MKRLLLYHIGFLFSFTTSAQDFPDDSLISIQSLRYTISALSDDSMRGRMTGSAGAIKSALFIADRFKTNGLRPVAGFNGYFQHYLIGSRNGDSIGAINVIAALPGKISPDTMVIFCAHYDHIGYNPEAAGRDSIFNGANDNASGVATIIELARYYAVQQINRYTLLFIAFSGEELGLLGSKAFTSLLDRNNVHAVINFDMVGSSTIQGRNCCMVIGDNALSSIKKLNKYLALKKKFFLSDRYPTQFLNVRSDHHSFAEYKNCFSIICTSPEDKLYHTTGDETQTIDFEFLLQVAINSAKGCEVFLR